ncbi:MAG: isopentenyl phosphate kinase [Candidatus Altiarchaeota archaeon]
MVELIVLKLGGSIITHKSEDQAKVNEKNLNRLCGEISSAKTKKGFKLVVVHGAGPYGHVLAKKFKLADGISQDWQLEGVPLTHQSMEQLNSQVVAALQKAGISAISLQPSAGGILQAKKLASFPVEVVEKLIEKDIVPVSYGDVLIDLVTGFNILSGDHLVPYLAEKLKATRVIIATDVDGILDEKGVVIPKITEKNSNQLNYTKVKGTDVTGGMKRKVEELFDLAINRNIDSCIINGSKPGVLEKTLEGKKVKGTKITS